MRHFMHENTMRFAECRLEIYEDEPVREENPEG
jgi:hypothetical protein